ncbi:GNAT family N-acetyltransferase [Actinotalea ferrariae]|uniref:GNAT family N-acetyltransferase n=1 Tax=Actinotalea ferrariae TaxID=1386098 RepID=UPI001C8C8C5F|nr:GNAT family N-acetyltransferase [Actinotalea ferrariae]
MTTLPGGLELRTSRPSDLDQIGALLVERGEEADALDHRLVVEGELGWDACAVVVDGDRVVSTATLLDEEVRVGDVVLPAGQVELVATDREYEGRGLVRALMGWAHDRSRDRGHLLQVMIGIPYFYRLFGYEYAIDMPRARSLRSDGSEADDVPVTAPAARDDLGGAATVPDGTSSTVGVRAAAPGGSSRAPGAGRLRPATEADVPVLAALQDAAQAPYDVAMPHPAERWRWILAHEGSTTWVLERGGSVVASARTGPPDDGVLVAEAAAVDDDAATALLAALADVGEPLTVVHRPLTVPGRAWADLLEPPGPGAEQYYARIERPELVLDALRPVLSARLRADDVGRDVVISTFGRHYRMPWTDEAGLGEVEVGGPMQSPGVAGGAGVAPDRLPALLLGPLGIDGLAQLFPDVYSGADRELFTALFPPQTADLLTYYLPW